jgi:hypothetical protein
LKRQSGTGARQAAQQWQKASISSLGGVDVHILRITSKCTGVHLLAPTAAFPGRLPLISALYVSAFIRHSP